MFSIDIPGFGRLEIEHFVTDFSGTLSEDGRLINGVRDKLNELARIMQIHVLTSDTFGRVRSELEGVQCALHVLEGADHTGQKKRYVERIGAHRVAAFGNGNNDVAMLKAAKLSIVVCLKEGCSVEALREAQIIVRSPIDAIDLFLIPKRLIATLRR